METRYHLTIRLSNTEGGLVGRRAAPSNNEVNAPLPPDDGTKILQGRGCLYEDSLVAITLIPYIYASYRQQRPRERRLLAMSDRI